MPIQTAIDSIGNSQGSPFGFKNRIINGGMVIDQRNAGGTTTASGSWAVDRFQFYVTQANKFTAQRDAGSVTPPPGFSNYLGFTSSSAYSVLSSDLFETYQIIEGYNWSDMDWGKSTAKSVTLSFWVRSSLTGTFGGVVMNSSQNYNYPYSYTINSANTWEYKTITVPGATSGSWLGTYNNCVTVGFLLAAGSQWLTTPGSWTTSSYHGATGQTSLVGTNGATFYITGVQVEKGTQATLFDNRSYSTEMGLCQRYYYSLTNGANLNQSLGNWTCHSAADARTQLFFPVQMRIGPSLQQTTGTNYYRLEGYAGKNFTTLSIAYNTITAALIYNNSELGSSMTAGSSMLAYSNNASTLVAFNAEF